jgi:hypothetical protein
MAGTIPQKGRRRARREVKVSKRSFEGETVRRASRDHLLKLGYQAGAQMVEAAEAACPDSLLQ